MTLRKWQAAGWQLHDATLFFQTHERAQIQKRVQRINGIAPAAEEAVQPQDFFKLEGVSRVERLSGWQDDGWELLVEGAELKLCTWGIRKKEVLGGGSKVEDLGGGSKVEETEDVDDFAACAELHDFLSAFTF